MTTCPASSGRPCAEVAAGALVTPGTVVPTGQLWAGAPAKFMREMTAAEKAFTVTSAETYAELGAVHATEAGCCNPIHVETRVESAWSLREKLRYDNLLSSFAFNSKLRLCSAAAKSHEDIEHDKAVRVMARQRDGDYDSHLGVTRDQVKVQV